MSAGIAAAYDSAAMTTTLWSFVVPYSAVSAPTLSAVKGRIASEMASGDEAALVPAPGHPPLPPRMALLALEVLIAMVARCGDARVQAMLSQIAVADTRRRSAAGVAGTGLVSATLSSANLMAVVLQLKQICAAMDADDAAGDAERAAARAAARRGGGGGGGPRYHVVGADHHVVVEGESNYLLPGQNSKYHTSDGRPRAASPGSSFSPSAPSASPSYFASSPTSASASASASPSSSSSRLRGRTHRSTSPANGGIVDGRGLSDHGWDVTADVGWAEFARRRRGSFTGINMAGVVIDRGGMGKLQVGREERGGENITCLLCRGCVVACAAVMWCSDVVPWCGAVVWCSGVVVQRCGAVVWCSGVEVQRCGVACAKSA
jgi:hypothetical protein